MPPITPSSSLVGGRHGDGFLHPFDGRVARAADAARVVVPMPESGDETPTPFEPDAYESPEPAIYRYRQQADAGVHTGLVCTFDAAALADGRVRGHEAIQPARLAALVDHLARGPARVELVTTMHRAGSVFRRMLGAEAGAPLVDVGTGDGVRHTIWRLDADAALLAEMSATRHYVADGHHRVAAGLTLWERAGRPASFPIGCVAYDLGGLDLAAFHRLLPGPVDATAVLGRLADGYHVAAADLTEAGEPIGPGDVRVRVGGRWYVAHRNGPRPDGARGLAVAMLEDTLTSLALQPARIGVAELREAADTTHGAGFALDPPALDEVLALADAGEIVPAKTTYFTPKPASGLFVRRTGRA